MLDNHNINKDLLKSVITHGLIVVCIVVVGFIENRKIFSDLRTNQALAKADSHKQTVLPTIVQANLVDRQMVQQAVKRQEMQMAEKIMKEKKIQQQEQQLAQLTKVAEQELLKAKQEALQAKQDRDKLKKEQDNLQQATNKLKQQAKELSVQQEKLDKLKQQQSQKKNLAQTQSVTSKENETKNAVDFQAAQAMVQTEVNRYHSKWHTEIVNNRKRTMLFPENLKCSVKIKVLSNGQLALVRIDKSSGNSAYDAFSEQAIYKSAPFEMPKDPIVNQELAELEHIFDFDDSAFNND